MMSVKDDSQVKTINRLSRFEANKENFGFCFHMHILALLSLCVFTFILCIFVYNSVIDSEDKPYHEAFTTQIKSVTLGVAIQPAGNQQTKNVHFNPQFHKYLDFVLNSTK